MLGDGPVEGRDDTCAGHAVCHIQDRTPATPMTDDGQHSERTAVAQPIADVHVSHSADYTVAPAAPIGFAEMARAIVSAPRLDVWTRSSSLT